MRALTQKKNITLRVAACLLALLSLPFGVLSLSAAAKERAVPTVEIVAHNVYYGEKIQLAFAVSATGLAEGDGVQLSLYDGEGERLETVNKSEKATVKGQEALVFVARRGVSLSALGERVYAKAEIVQNGVTVAESATEEYSALEYFMERLTVDNDAGGVSAKQKRLYDAVMAAAKAAEVLMPEATTGKTTEALRYVSVAGVANTYEEGARITAFSHGLTLGTGDTVVWQIDTYDEKGNYVDSVAQSDADIVKNGYTVGKYSAVITPRVNAPSETELRSQVISNGNAQAPNGSKANYTKRASVRFAIALRKGAVITFTGNTEVYGFAVVETDNTSNVYKNGAYFKDSGWLSGNTYTTTADCTPMLIFKRNDGAAITASELKALILQYTVTGQKTAVHATRGTLTKEEFLRQPALWGSIPNPEALTRQRIVFGVRMKAGARITFTGKTSVYQWAVAETQNTAIDDRAFDTGWNNTWASPDAAYYTQLNGGFPVLNIKRVDGANLTEAEIDAIHGMFTVEGQKYVDTDTVSLDFARYTVNSVNHRGYSDAAPENTLAAYRLSAQSGFNMVECDVNFTSDGVPVLLHDSTVDRTSNGSGSITSMTLAEVRALDFGSWKSPLYKGEKIPTFEEFVALCARLGLHPYIELKSSLSSAQAKKLVEIVKAYGMLDGCTWISFKEAALKNVLTHDPTARVGLLSDSVTADVITAAKGLKRTGNEVFIDAKYTGINATVVTLCRNAGFALEVYTVNTLSDIHALDPYVSGVTSDCIVAGKYR